MHALQIVWTADRLARFRTRTPEQLAGTLSALDVKLSSDQMKRLDEVSAVSLGTPHEQIQGSTAEIAGGKPELLAQPSVPVA